MSTTTKAKRLRPGELDGPAHGHMAEHKDDKPLTISTIGQGIGRSSGAVANCLVRLEKQGKVRQAKRKPRSYGLAGAKEK